MSDMLTKEETAALLGVELKTVERYSKPDKQGRVRLTPKHEKRRVFYKRAEVEALKAKMEEPPAALVRVSDTTDKGLVSRRSAGGGELVQAFAMALERVLPVPVEGAQGGKLLLTLAEAAEATGLSEYQLRKDASAGKLHARKLGRGWRVRPGDLRRYVDRIMEEPPEEPKPRPKGKTDTTEA